MATVEGISTTLVSDVRVCVGGDLRPAVLF